jgi:peptidoglycan/xylan/chitin deacetylase (PgdA/CDA1 family)
MRFDRFITLRMVKPLKLFRDSLRSNQPQTPHHQRTLPILMYHSISDDPELGLHPYYRVCTSPRRFAEHMHWLADNGWRGVTLSEGLDWLKTPSPPARSGGEDQGAVGFDALSLTPKPVAITFDDGFGDFNSAAVPVLQRHGFRATMFLPTAFIGDSHRPFAPPRHAPPASPTPPRRECLTWSEVRQLHGGGFEFGSHTISHPVLSGLSWPAIEKELEGSRAELQTQLASPVTAFAHPFAFPQEDQAYVRRLSELLCEAGYTCAVTTRVGRVRLNDSPFTLQRLPVNELDDHPLFLAKLAGAYDWIAVPQLLRRKLRQATRTPSSGPPLAPTTPNPATPI